MDIYSLGSSVQGNDSPHPILILHLILGTTGRNFTANFTMVDEGLIFGAEYCSIKESVIYMNKRKESGGGQPGRIQGIPSLRMDTYGAKVH